ncbi:MAG: glutaminyl-peptide cyclotransferase [Bacteroidales bacterium]|nr:glutaminyl-peptide cyclotransferase [Bacteroidales bacterium]
MRARSGVNFRAGDTDVLNGIAYDPKSRRLYITGKNWPTLFQVEINF